jgi:hypothetical protein
MAFGKPVSIPQTTWGDRYGTRKWENGSLRHSLQQDDCQSKGRFGIFSLPDGAFEPSSRTADLLR